MHALSLAATGPAVAFRLVGSLGVLPATAAMYIVAVHDRGRYMHLACKQAKATGLTLWH